MKGKQPRYPWDAWFSQPAFLLTKGVDFRGRTDTMIQQVRQQAHNRGKRLRVWSSEDGGVIRVTVVG